MKNFTLFSILVCLVFFACQPSTPKTENEAAEPSSEVEKKQVNEPENAQLPPFDEWVKFGMDLGTITPEGVKVGETAPGFSATDHQGNIIKIDSLLESGPVVLQFYRGQWCPVCTRYLAGFQDSLSMITAKGAHVIAITPETNENINKTVEMTKVSYPVISDRNYQIMDAYKVTFDVTEDYSEKIKKYLSTDIAENNGSQETKLPVPATFIIGQGGQVKFAQFNPNYKNRASVKDILSFL